MIRGVVCFCFALVVLFTGCRDESLGPGKPVIPVSDGRPADARGAPADAASAGGTDAPTADLPAADGAAAEDTAAGDARAPSADVGASPDGSAEAAPPPDGAAAGPGDAPPGPATLRRGLVLFLPLDDGPGSFRARDDSGHMHTTALRELDPARAWAPGRFGNGLALAGDAAGGWLRVTPADSLNSISKGLTISAWIKRPAQGDAGGTIVSRQAIGPGGYLYNFQISDNRLRIRLHSGNGYRLDLLGELLIPRDTWSHLLVSYDQIEARLYIDGALAGNARFGLGLPAENSALAIGASLSGGNETAGDRLLGVLDEVLVYDRALTADEVKALARGQRP